MTQLLGKVTVLRWGCGWVERCSSYGLVLPQKLGSETRKESSCSTVSPGAAANPDPSPGGKCFSVDVEQHLGGSISLACWDQRPNLLELPFGQVTSLSLYFLNSIMGIIMESTIRVVVKIK